MALTAAGRSISTQWKKSTRGSEAERCALLIDVVALARHVGIVADDAGEQAVPAGTSDHASCGVEVLAQADVMIGIAGMQKAKARRGYSAPSAKAGAGSVSSNDSPSG